jgi:EEF1A lysine methyltransferase 4
MSDGASAGVRPEDLEEDGITPRKGSRLYTTREYWEFRFQAEEKKDWLAASEVCIPILLRVLPERAPVLVVGCGNSSLSEDLAKTRQYDRILSTDFSEHVIERMRARTADVEGLEWSFADMSRLGDLGETWASIVDKGAMDAIVADGGDSWSPPPATSERGRSASSSIASVLRPGGLYVQISFGQPHFRRHFLLPDKAEKVLDASSELPSEPTPSPPPKLSVSPKARYLGHSPSLRWRVWVEDLDVGLGYFVYLCRKDEE